MSKNMVFVVTRRERSEVFSDFVSRNVIPVSRNSVVILEEEAFGIGGNGRVNDTTQAAKNISDFIEDANAGNDSFLLIDKEILASQDKIRNRWLDSGNDLDSIYNQSQRRVLDKFKRVLMIMDIHWETYAENQLNRFRGRTTALNTWCQQFFDLNVGYVGRRLAMQLQVIDFGDQNDPFAPRLHETFGQKVLHCYFDDGDHGGSWVSVKDQISHDLPAEFVTAIEVSGNELKFPQTDADEIVIYEDGLWSGIETVKRLKAIKESGLLRPIRFKFVVVTDFGLMVARQAIRHFGLQNVVKVDAADSRLERFLVANIPSVLRLGLGIEPDKYFEELHSYVELGAFRNPEDWPKNENVDRAREVAEKLGRQLVKQWYERKHLYEKADEGAEKFCLGGGRFASTMVFTRSVPKVCLPLFWLDGEVSLNGKTIKWEPLFLDARYVDPKLLRS